MQIDHNYLPQQFADNEAIFDEIRQVVARGDFTLGAELEVFERAFAKMVGVKHAIGVGNGTDALTLALRTLRKDTGGDVITTPFSFYATTAAIVNAGFNPVFVDVRRDFNIDARKIEAAVTKHTVGILPVHWAGRPCNMNIIMAVAKLASLWVVEDSAHAPGASYAGRQCGSFGDINAFSLHPLKNVNVWGDGGVVVTNDQGHAAFLRELRNHGMRDRNTVAFWGVNSRLDTIQAIVARHVLENIEQTTAARRANAALLNATLSGISDIELPHEHPDVEPNYYLYTFLAQRRDDLVKHLIAAGIDAKIHYPTPLHLQPAAKSLGYKRGDFPVAEYCAAHTVSIPVHDWITLDDIDFMVATIRRFYT